MCTPDKVAVISPFADAASSISNVDADDAAPAASTRRRIMRRQTAAAAATAVAKPAAKLATAAHLSGLAADGGASTCISTANSAPAAPLQPHTMIVTPSASPPSAAPAWRAPAAEQAPALSLQDAAGQPLDCRPVTDARWAAPLTGAWCVLLCSTRYRQAARFAAIRHDLRLLLGRYIVVPLTAGGSSPQQRSMEPEQGAEAPDAEGMATPVSPGSLPCAAGLRLDWAAVDAVARGFQVAALLCLSVISYSAGLLYLT